MLDPDPEIPILFLNYFLALSISPTALIFSGLLVVILLLFSAMVSGSEIAFFSLDNNQIKTLGEDTKQSSLNILSLRDRPRRLLATILISNNFINIAIVLVSDFLLNAILPLSTTLIWAEGILDRLSFLNFLFTNEGLGKFIHLSITIVGVTFLLVLFGEVAPKVYAKFNNVTLARNMSRPLLFLEKLFHPLSSMLVSGSNFLERKLDKYTNSESLTSREDVAQAIELTVQSETDAEQEIDILKSIVKFGDLNVKQIMRSRVDVISVDFRLTFKELMGIIQDCGYSRLPVYEDDFDTVTGILYVKDLIPHIDKADYEWQQLVRPTVFYAPESKKISDLLKEFQIQKVHMAIVVDEYGGSSGIVTLEDIMEEVIGEIKDEKDELKEIDFERIDEHTFIFEGKTLLNDICRVVNIETDTFDRIRGDADTIAGMILELTGMLPKQGREFSFGGYLFKIMAVDKRRIKRIKIKLPADQ